MNRQGVQPRVAVLAAGLSLALWMIDTAAWSDPPPLPAATFADYTLEDFLTHAKAHNPGLVAARQRYEAALEGIPQAVSLPDPMLRYGLTAETGDGPRMHAVSAMQTFPLGDKLARRGDVARRAAEVEHARYRQAKWELLEQVKEVYFEYYYLGRAVEIIDHAIALLQYLEDLAAAEYRVGMAGYTDVMRLQVELGRLEDERRTLQELAPALTARLLAMLAHHEWEVLPFPQPMGAVRLATSEEAVLELLREHSPQLRILEREAETMRARAQVAQREGRPDLTLELGYGRMTNMPSGGMASGGDEIMLGVGINLPLWQNRIRAGVREAHKREAAVLSERDNSENLLIGRARMLLYQFHDAGRKIDLYARALIPRAEQALLVSEEEYRTGETRMTDLIEAERALLEFELAHERAVADQGLRLARLETLVGRAIPHSAAYPTALEEEEDEEEETP